MLAIAHHGKATSKSYNLPLARQSFCCCTWFFSLPQWPCTEFYNCATGVTCLFLFNPRSCAWCGASLAGQVSFERLTYKYCSTACVKAHRLDMEGRVCWWSSFLVGEYLWQHRRLQTIQSGTIFWCKDRASRPRWMRIPSACIESVLSDGHADSFNVNFAVIDTFLVPKNVIPLVASDLMTCFCFSSIYWHILA